MPYPNYHVVHLIPFSRIKPETVFTKYGGTIGDVAVPDDVWVRYGALERTNEVVPFSMGFPAEKYTLDDVRTYLTENEISYIEIIPSSDEGSSSQRYRSISLSINDFRITKRQLNGDIRKLYFKGIARTNNPVNTSSPLNEYDDIETLRIPSSTIPIDYNHDLTKIIGKVTSIRKRQDALIIKGQIISSRPDSIAARIIDEIIAGIHYQLSIFTTADSQSYVEEIENDPTGRYITPAIVFKNYILRGVAITGYGADPMTRIFPISEPNSMKKEVIMNSLPQNDLHQNDQASSNQPDPDVQQSRQPEAADPIARSADPSADAQPATDEQSITNPQVMDFMRQLDVIHQELSSLKELLTGIVSQLQNIEGVQRKQEELDEKINHLQENTQEIQRSLQKSPLSPIPAFSPDKQVSTTSYFRQVAEKFGLPVKKK